MPDLPELLFAKKLAGKSAAEADNHIIYMDENATLDAIIPTELFQEVASRLYQNSIFGLVYFEFGGNTGLGRLFSVNGSTIATMMFTAPGSSVSDAIGVHITWTSNGVGTCKVLMNGQLQDMSAVLSQIPATVVLFGTSDLGASA